MTDHLTWFITGSTRGFGRALVEAALDTGDRVVASARRPDQLGDLVERYPDRILPVALDVTDAAAAVAAVTAGVDRFGALDVVVNNAGFADISAVETTSPEDFRRQFETNFWGVYNVSLAALPVLKDQGAGLIVQFSSVGGRVGGTPGLGSYQAAKFGIDGLTRVLAAETGPLGIRYIVVEPGGFATDWAGSSMRTAPIPEEYRATVGAFAEAVRGGAHGHPARAAEILVRIARREEPPSHLLLGAGAVRMALEYSRHQIDEAALWGPVSTSADFGAEYPVDLPAARTEDAR